MDSQKAIDTVVGLKSWYDAYSQAFNVVLNILDTGYQTDQVRIDTAIQSFKDSVATQITDLQTQIDSKDAEIASLKQQLGLS